MNGQQLSQAQQAALLGAWYSQFNPITHLKDRASQIYRAATAARRLGSRIDPIAFLSRRIPGGGGGGGAPAPAPAPDPVDDGSYDDSTEGWPPPPPGFMRRHHHRRRAAMLGWSFASLNPFAKKAAADAAGAVKSGELKPAHLSAAGKLVKLGRAGSQKALVKIAAVTHKARRGDPAAKKAHKALTLAQTMQTGGRYVAPRRAGGGAISRTYHAGVATIRT